MRNRISTSEAASIGFLLREARLKRNLGIKEVGLSLGVHHSQVSRCERGNFKTASLNVQKMCKYFDVKHEKMPKHLALEDSLRARFETLLSKMPASAAVFERLFDVLEASQKSKVKHRKA